MLRKESSELCPPSGYPFRHFLLLPHLLQSKVALPTPIAHGSKWSWTILTAPISCDTMVPVISYGIADSGDGYPAER